MGCFFSSAKSKQPAKENAVEEVVILSIPGAQLFVLDGGEISQLGHGEFLIMQLKQDGIPVAIIVKVGTQYQWPLTKDEAVVKVNDLHYVFSFSPPSHACEESKVEIMSYGVKFPITDSPTTLVSLDTYLHGNSCFSALEKKTGGGEVAKGGDHGGKSGCFGSQKKKKGEDECWTSIATRIPEYQGVLSKAIASGTGVTDGGGVFKVKDEYKRVVEHSGEALRSGRKMMMDQGTSSKKNRGFLRQSIRRARKLSSMMEKLTQAFLNGVLIASGGVTGALIHSQAGKQVFGSMPGQVVLGSLDAVNKVLDVAETAGRGALSATAGATTKMVSKKLGEGAGEVTEDVLATSGHMMGTALNLFKIRKAMVPKKTTAGSLLKNAAKK